jgi:acyl-CoA synthetase (AMP-forming)/AMP-acid ligase II/thioesterase domain-containing protein/acyl carrier protein
MHSHLADLVTSLAARRPEARVFTFLHSDRDEQIITAGALHRDACRIAELLHEHGVQRSAILPLVFEHGYELLAAFWGAVYLGAVPTILPYASPDARAPAPAAHIARLVRFTHACTVVTTAELRSALDQTLAGTACRTLALPPWPLDGVDAASAGWPADEPTEPPYIQFSSGTTSTPKGVVLSHAALLHYCHAAVTDFAITPDEVTVGWLPLYHDMGLLTQVLEPLTAGRHSVLMSPDAWLSEPHRLFTAIDRFRGTITWMPNFAFRYCTRRVRDEQIAGVDLSSWGIVGNASEPVLPEDLDGFARRFAPYGLDRRALTVSYGLAEHVAGVTWTPRRHAPAVEWVTIAGLEEGRAVRADPRAPGSRPVVSCGYPIPSVTLRIVGRDERPLAEREVGEVLVRSPMLFTGYYAMAEESAAALRDGWLHTGDLGYLADGQLHVCGRTKDLIIVGGRNIHPSHLEEIVASVQGHGGRFAAAFGVPNPQLGTETPVVVCEMRQPLDDASRVQLRQDVREQLRRTLNLFVGDVHVVDKGWVVRTTSGKINRAASRAKYLAERADADPGEATERAVAEAPALATDTAQRLIGVWETLFNQQGLTPAADFFTLGGDSLLAAQLALEIEERFRCSLPATALLAAPTIAGLARLIDAPAPPGERETLVALQAVETPTDRPRFFCVHGLGGGVLDYRPLAQALGPRQPFYALQARGLDGADPIDHSIEAMAAHYVCTIKAVQPTGPYYLGGYCFGGVVAYEMARQLIAAADDVALVAVLEGYAPSGEGPRGGWRREWGFALHFVRALPYWVRDYLQLERMQMRARNRRLVRVARKRLLRLAGIDVALEGQDLVDGLISRPAKLQRLLEGHLAAARRYAPAPYAGRIVLFRTPRTLLQAPQRDMGWSRLSTEPVDVQMIAGSHATILAEPHVRVLADTLGGFLSVRERPPL